MSSRIHWRGQKILDLCDKKNREQNEQKETDPPEMTVQHIPVPELSAQQAPIPEICVQHAPIPEIPMQCAPIPETSIYADSWSVIENVEFEFLNLSALQGIDNSFIVENITEINPDNRNELTTPTANNDTLANNLTMLLPNDIITVTPDKNVMTETVTQTKRQNLREEVQFQDSNVVSVIASNSVESPLINSNDCNNNLDSEDITEQSTVHTAAAQETENCSRNSAEILTDNVPSLSNILHQLEDPISDGSDYEGLVPYRVNSDSDSEDDNYPEKSKKRKKRVQVQKSNWFARKNRKLRESGKKYYGKKKGETWDYEVPKDAKIMKNRCQCKETDKGTLKCSTFTETDRQDLFKKFWNMSWAEKKVHVDSLVTSLPVKRPRGRKVPEASKRAQSMFYYLKKEDQLIKVCRTMFLNTLGIGRWTVLHWKNKGETGSKTSKKDKNSLENRSSTTSSKPFALERQELKTFLESLPVMESHYCRASTEKKYLLPEWRSKRSLYEFYVNDWCKIRNVRPLSIAVFHEEFDAKNLGLYFPKKDQCEICALFKVGNLSQEKYLEHQAKKEEARAEKEKDKAEERLVFTVDLQAVLMAPKSKISSLYYRTKLQVHNLAFCNLKNKDGFCYLWNETEGGLNSEEFASIWVDFIEKKILPQNDCDGPTKIIFYSDGCTYQNRNCVLANALLLTAMNHNIILEQKILEVGHTQMEADSIHSTVERSLKNKNINVPAEYISICKAARKKPRPYDVSYLCHSFFKKFDEVQFFKSIRPGRGKGDAKVNDIRALRYTPNGDIFYKLRFSDEWTILPQRKSLNVTAQPFESLQNLHLTKRKITNRKFEDLQYLKNTLPEDYRQYYDNLPHD